MIQADFFIDVDTQALKEEVKRLKESNEKVRKSLFAKHGELAKNYLELMSRLEILERFICGSSYADQANISSNHIKYSPEMGDIFLTTTTKKSGDIHEVA